MAENHFKGSPQNLGSCCKKENRVIKKVIPDFKKGILFSKRTIPFSRRDILFSKIWSLLWANVWAHVEPRVAKEPIWSQGGYKIDDIMKNIEKPSVFLTFWAALRPPVAKTMCFSMFSRGMFQNTCVFRCFGAEPLRDGIRRYTPAPYQERQNPYRQAVWGITEVQLLSGEQRCPVGRFGASWWDCR